MTSCRNAATAFNFTTVNVEIQKGRADGRRNASSQMGEKETQKRELRQYPNLSRNRCSIYGVPIDWIEAEFRSTLS